MKKRLTQQQEFEIMKMVLDKFLWISTIVMLYGLYAIFTANLTTGLTWIVIGAIVFILFMILIVKEYEIVK